MRTLTIPALQLQLGDILPHKHGYGMVVEFERLTDKAITVRVEYDAESIAYNGVASRSNRYRIHTLLTVQRV